jgi:glycerol-3-phosphate dehydrogenase
MAPPETTLPTIPREPAAVAGRGVDVVVLGAGINGVLTALELAARGAEVLLVDREDFGSGASFNSLRTIHGGLRYLQHLDLRRAVASHRQRNWWLTHFPDLVAPIRCVLPLYNVGMRRPAAFRGAFLLARALGLSRTPSRAAGGMEPAFQVLSPTELRARVPSVRMDGLTGGAVWSDAFMPDSQRVVMEAVRWAVSAGAHALNYCELMEVTGAGAGRSALEFCDRLTGASFTVKTNTIVNVTGAHVDGVGRKLTRDWQRLLNPTLAWNVLLDVPPPADVSVAIAPPERDARTYFVHPYRGKTLLGTGHVAWHGDAANAWPSDAMIEHMLHDAEAALPGAGLADANIVHVLAGILPGVRRGSDAIALRPRIVRHAVDAGGSALVSVLGVKFTEAPTLAAQVADRIVPRRIQLPSRPRAGVGWSVAGEELDMAALRTLAACEQAVCVDDLVLRRTDAWSDPAACARITEQLRSDLLPCVRPAHRPSNHVEN